ncbi:hypothetical protein KKF59_04435 [Patescibacteria group bacterium]|nr:hypothetical protein [Patescibacteria group bacterium]MBU1908342.1 hypothetical protein [Patescibacteria group bacterium]
MKNAITKDIINHLEFLGYTIEIEENDTSDILTCMNDARSNVMVLISAGFVLFSSRYLVEIDKPTIELYKIIGEINSKTNISKWYLSTSSKNEMVVAVEGYLYGYEKLALGRVLEAMERDYILNMPKIRALKEGRKQ